MANTNNRDNNDGNILNLQTDDRTDENLETSNQEQNLGGSKGDEKTISVGTSDDTTFSKTDQSISQAAPGQTATNTNQGGSNVKFTVKKYGKPETRVLLLFGFFVLYNVRKIMSVQSVHQFAEKVALVTDGTSEIGRAVAIQLALQGSFIIVGFSSGNERATSALTELKNLGTLAHAVETDCSTAAGARRLVAEVENIYGRLDLLVNCLKFKSDSTFDEMEESDWTQTVDANLKATFFVTQAAVKLMRARPKAAIVNVLFDCSVDDENDLAFAATQAGIVDLTKNLAAWLAPKIRVNALKVAKSSRKSVENLDAELFRPASAIVADDAARAVLFLLSSEAVALRGQVLKVG